MAGQYQQLYLSSIRSFGKFLQRPAAMSDLTDDTVGMFLNWFMQKGRSPYSANKEHANLLAIWRFACRKQILKTWPDVEREVEPKRIPLAWTEEEMHQLFASLAREEGRIGVLPAAAWWTALHFIAWDTGERISALRNLKWKYVDMRRGWLHIPAEIRKGKREDKVFKLSADTLASLTLIQKPKREDVFPFPYSHTYLYDLYAKVLERAGLPTDRKSKFHRLRKSVASHVEAAGGNATSLLGHSTRKVTMNYLDPRIVGEKHAADMLFRPKAAE